MTVNYALVDSTTGKRHPVREDVPIDLEKQAADKKISAFARLIARLV